MNNEILEQLKELAFSRSIPFCYSCYKETPTGCCKHCGSDDLMRLVPGVGCEYGTDWVIKHILETELIAVDLEEEPGSVESPHQTISFRISKFIFLSDTVKNGRRPRHA